MFKNKVRPEQIRVSPEQIQRMEETDRLGRKYSLIILVGIIVVILMICLI